MLFVLKNGIYNFALFQDDLRIKFKHFGLLRKLNAWDKRWLDQPDFETRLDCFKEIGKFIKNEVDEENEKLALEKKMAKLARKKEIEELASNKKIEKSNLENKIEKLASKKKIKGFIYKEKLSLEFGTAVIHCSFFFLNGMEDFSIRESAGK